MIINPLFNHGLCSRFNSFDLTPKSINSEFIEVFNEYPNPKTEEAKFAQEINKLETIFQSIQYSKRMD